MPDLETDLSEFWDDLIGKSQPVDVDALIAGTPRVTADDDIVMTELFDVHAKLGSSGDDLTVNVIWELDEPTPPEERRAPLAVAAAVAAAILLIVGVAVIADGANENVVTDPVSSATPPDTVPSSIPPDPTPEVSDPGPPPSVLDQVSSYRWSRVPYDEEVFGEDFEEWMGSVTVGGPGLVAVGSGVWTSVDGVAWSRVPDDEAIFDGPINGVTAGGPGLVAVGVSFGAVEDGAAVWTSIDGVAWSRVAHDEAIFDGAAMTSVTAGGPGLVAVGWDGHPHGEVSNAVVWTSVDGVIWSRVPHDEAIFGNVTGAWMTGVTAGGPGLVAIGWDSMGAAVWTSVDGLSWSRVPYDEAVFGTTVMRSVTEGGPGLVAVGSEWLDNGSTLPSSGVVWTSVDGIAWSRVPNDEAVLGQEGTEINSVTAGGPGLVAIGWDSMGAAVWTSVDGLTWSRVPHDEAVFGAQPKPLLEMRSVIAGGPGLVAVGANTVNGASGATDSDAVVFIATFED